MRTHGWSGEPPADDDEARRRILTAARTFLEQGRSASTSEIAAALGVTRQTVYRYFPSTEELLNAAALDAVEDLVDGIVDHVRAHLEATGGDAADAAVEVVAYFYEHLYDDVALNRLVAPGRIATTVAGLTAPTSITLGRSLLASFPVDWTSAGLDESTQPELVEHLLRTLQTFLLDPGDPRRTGAELRAYLNRWLAPTLRWDLPGDSARGPTEV